MNLESTSATWSFFPEEYNVRLCSPPDQSGWSSQVSSKWTSLDWLSPDWTFVWDAFFFPSNAFLSCETPDLTMLPFFIFNELTNILNCLTVSTRRFSQQFSYIIQQKQTKRRHSGLHGISVEYEDKRDMMQCCFYNWFCSTVHSIMVYRNPITANCSSKHEHLARNDSASFALCQFFLVSL